MSTALYQLLGHLYVATSDEGKKALKTIGVSGDRITKGEALRDRVIADLDELNRNTIEDRVLEHSVHASATEVEMWLQTCKYKLSRAGLDDELVHKALGHHLHPHNHILAVVAQALRFLAMLRSHDEIQQAFGETRRALDVLVRGNTLLRKLFKQSDILLDPTKTRAKLDNPHFKKLAASRVELLSWVGSLFENIEGAADSKLHDMGIVGYVPEDKGLPAGGTAYDVLLHHRARSEAPENLSSPPTSGWSVGRQGGRNRENLGKGWLDAQDSPAE